MIKRDKIDRLNLTHVSWISNPKLSIFSYNANLAWRCFILFSASGLSIEFSISIGRCPSNWWWSRVWKLNGSKSMNFCGAVFSDLKIDLRLPSTSTSPGPPQMDPLCQNSHPSLCPIRLHSAKILEFKDQIYPPPNAPLTVIVDFLDFWQKT